MKRLSLIPLLALLVGCAHEGHALESRTYDIILKNQTPEPVTLVLQKESGPREDAWLTPEELASGPASAIGKWGLEAVPAGKAVAAKNVQGEFDPGSRAWLRVYRGAPNVGEMLKIKPGADRVDVPLNPGVNRFEVKSRESRLEVTPLPAAR